jgi:hypothetical protein
VGIYVSARNENAVYIFVHGHVEAAKAKRFEIADAKISQKIHVKLRERTEKTSGRPVT